MLKKKIDFNKVYRMGRSKERPLLQGSALEDLYNDFLNQITDLAPKLDTLHKEILEKNYLTVFATGKTEFTRGFLYPSLIANGFTRKQKKHPIQQVRPKDRPYTEYAFDQGRRLRAVYQYESMEKEFSYLYSDEYLFYSDDGEVELGIMRFVWRGTAYLSEFTQSTYKDGLLVRNIKGGILDQEGILRRLSSLTDEHYFYHYNRLEKCTSVMHLISPKIVDGETLLGKPLAISEVENDSYTLHYDDQNQLTGYLMRSENPEEYGEKEFPVTQALVFPFQDHFQELELRAKGNWKNSQIKAISAPITKPPKVRQALAKKELAYEKYCSILRKCEQFLLAASEFEQLYYGFIQEINEIRTQFEPLKLDIKKQKTHSLFTRNHFAFLGAGWLESIKVVNIRPEEETPVWTTRPENGKYYEYIFAENNQLLRMDCYEANLDNTSRLSLEQLFLPVIDSNKIYTAFKSCGESPPFDILIYGYSQYEDGHLIRQLSGGFPASIEGDLVEGLSVAVEKFSDVDDLSYTYSSGLLSGCKRKLYQLVKHKKDYRQAQVISEIPPQSINLGRDETYTFGLDDIGRVNRYWLRSEAATCFAEKEEILNRPITIPSPNVYEYLLGLSTF